MYSINNENFGSFSHHDERKTQNKNIHTNNANEKVFYSLNKYKGLNHWKSSRDGIIMTDYVEIIKQKDREIEEYKHDLYLAKNIIDNLSCCKNCGNFVNKENIETLATIDTQSENKSFSKESKTLESENKFGKRETPDTDKFNFKIQAKNKVLSKHIKSSVDNKKLESKTLNDKLLTENLFSSLCFNNELIPNNNKGRLDFKNINLISFIEKKLRQKMNKNSCLRVKINNSHSVANLSTYCK